MCGSNPHFLQNEILRQYWESTALIRVHQSEFCSKDLLPLYQKKPSERFELSTPGLQDQCSNPWATKAMHLEGKTKWRYCLAIFVCLLLIPTIRLSFAFSNSCIFLKLCVNASSPFFFYLMKSDSQCRDQDSNLGYCGHNAMCTNHYTITAIIQFSWTSKR